VGKQGIRNILLCRDGPYCQECGIEMLIAKAAQHRSLDRGGRGSEWNRAWTLDHIKPRSKGGTNDDDNLQLLCRRCNRAKSDS